MLTPGTKLGPYEILSPIGAGGMGEVYKAKDMRLDRLVAVKVLGAHLGEDKVAQARFEREAKAIAALSHPNILAIHDFGTHEGSHYAVMELLEGETLRERLAGGALPLPTAVEIAGQIARGLAAAHARGIVHRDLKPANVFITSEGDVKILDFGLAKQAALNSPFVPATSDDATADISTRTGTIVGTIGYMSPEQVRGLPADVRSDIFAYGAMLYEMLAGKRAFAGETPSDTLAAILTKDPDPLPPVTPPGLDRVVRQCMEKRQEERFLTARELLLALEVASSRLTPPYLAIWQALPNFLRESRYRWIVAGCGLLAVLTAMAGMWWYRQSCRERWVRREALPQLEAIVDRLQAGGEGREGWDAFLLARKIDAVAPGEPLVERLRPKFTTAFSITSDPPGATVCLRYYDEPDGAPLILGKTPLEQVPYPEACTRIQLTLPGHAAINDMCDWGWFEEVRYRFPRPGQVPDGMSLVPGGPFAMVLPSLQQLGTEATVPFAMDRYEVTNRDYKRFVDAGGYSDPKYWRHQFLEGGCQLEWKEAMARFTDSTGRPGPATWEAGFYPEGRGAYPVSGVSWYEAVAYAEWAGKSLPTVFHWNQVAFTPAGPRIISFANMNSSGPVPVGSTKSVNRFGVYDLAGNVREWVWNASDGGDERFILGGGWNDPDYAFEDAFAQPAFDRSPTNGFRCIRYLKEEPNLTALKQSVTKQVRDFKAEKPVPDQLFAQYLRQFAYDKTPLDARIEEEEKTEFGLRQRISFTAAYGNERMLAYLFLPPAGKPPYQVAVFFPGSGVIYQRSSKSLKLAGTEFLVKGGRALLYPIYKGTYERGDALASDIPSDTAAWRDHIIMWGKDLSRSIDYLETRKDIESGRLAYYGYSWGGQMGSILPAVEKRIKVSVLFVAGIPPQRPFPEVDPINYVTRVKQPTLILDGDLDYIFPKETSQRPLFELLGAPVADKKWLVYPGGHDVPRMEMIKESLAWLDHYLGPVS